MIREKEKLMEEINENLKNLNAAFNTHVPFTENQMIYIKSNVTMLFECATGRNYLKFSKFLYALAKANTIDLRINEYNYQLFWSLACCKNDELLEMMKWLYKVCREDNNKINIHAEGDSAFHWSLRYGNFHTAKWLYDTSKIDNNGPIDIHIYNEVNFRKICDDDHIGLAKWLYHLSESDNNGIINIRAENDEAFKKACDKGQKETAEWLCTLCKDYSITPTMISGMEISYKITNKMKIFRDKIKNILSDESSKLEKLAKMYKDEICTDTIKNIDNDEVPKYEICTDTIKNINKVPTYEICPICLSDNEKYQVILGCKHTVCITCFAYVYDTNNQCHYKCSGYIEYDDIKLIRCKSLTN